MLKKRLVAVLILRDGNVVQSEQFQHKNLIHKDPAIAVEFFDQWSADEIIVLDVSRNQENRQKFINAVIDLSRKCFVPMSIGGWIKSENDVSYLLRIGADKVIINTQAVRDPEFIMRCAKIFGSQCIIMSIDVRKTNNNSYDVYIDRGKEACNISPIELAKKMQSLGAGEIFLTSIDNEGVRTGYDLKLIQSVTKAIDIPLIAFGGVSEWQHLVDGIKIGNADAVSAANILHYTEGSLKKAKLFMRSHGIDVR